MSSATFAGFDTVIDVRSPAEFEEDHVPGAINLPVMSNSERAKVGTIYVQDSPFRARKMGAAIVARNAAQHLDGALADKPGGWRPLVYCWRGGQRSGSFTSILQQIGWRAEVLQGGYKAYRREVVAQLYKQDCPFELVLLDGNTGSGKTAVLRDLAEMGGQVLDLEACAEHRGSLLGAQGQQPAQKMFESRIATALSQFDPARPVVVEAESSKIGRLIIPAMLWKAMLAAPRIEISATLDARASFLTRDYAETLQDGDAMSRALDKLRPYCSHDQVDHWLSLLEQRCHEQLAQELMRSHYDPGYIRARRAHSYDTIGKLKAQSLCPQDIARLAQEVAALLDQIKTAR